MWIIEPSGRELSGIKRHVVSGEKGWHVEKENARRPSATAPTQTAAIARATEIVANNGGGTVVVHAADGHVRDTVTVAPDAPTSGTGTGGTTEDSVTTRPTDERAGAVRDSVRAAASTAADAVAEVGRDTATTAKQARGHLAATARETTDADAAAADVAGDLADVAREDIDPAEPLDSATDTVRETTARASDSLARTGRQVRGEVAATARRAADTVTDNGAEVTDSLARGAVNAAAAGERAEDRLAAESDRIGRRIHTVTERAAAPLDGVTGLVLRRVEWVSRALNPVRVTGRTVGVAVAGGLYLASRVTGRAARTGHRSARALADTGR